MGPQLTYLPTYLPTCLPTYSLTYQPWVLSDYTSDTLDLSNPAVYRDLSKPMGAQRPERTEEIVGRFETLKELEGVEGQPPPFHYGSHYSSAAFVLFYLIRLEPFTTLAIRLQGGFFDHADRLFHSFDSTFRNACTSSSDVKELIPELFYLPEALCNVNGINLGVRQDGVQLDGIELPPWASDAHDFVRKHQQALESEYVSAHLHEWVDLIFGFKQRGRAAEEAVNVFYYLTYEGEVDLDAIDDPRERAATEAQISNFGTTPSQLLTRPHPPRFAPDPAATATVCSMPHEAQLLLERQLSRSAVIAIAASHERLVCIGADRRTSTHRWLARGVLEGASTKGHAADDGKGRPPFGVPFVEGLQERVAGRFAQSADGRHLFSCGYWDRSIRCSNLTDGRSVQSLRAHADVVSCLALSPDGAAVRICMHMHTRACMCMHVHVHTYMYR